MSIPLSDSFSDAAMAVIDSDDIGELYDLYERYADSLKARARKR
jgi:hypothetical protein